MTSKSQRTTKVKRGSLHYAFQVCDISQLKSIISKTDIDEKAVLDVMNLIKRSREIHRGSLTPLQGAVILGHYDICKRLVEEGAVMESLSTVPHPLCLALQKGHHEIAHFLIESGADVKMPFAGKLPLRYTLDNEQCPLEIVEDIIAAGFPANGIIRHSDSETALHAAVEVNHTDVVKYLLALPVNPNSVDKNGMTPLHLAVQRYRPNLVKLLVRAGATVDCECFQNCTPMFYAITSRKYEMVKLLLSLGADIHYVNGSKEFTMTPLHLAAYTCGLKITQLLLEKGADVNRKVALTGEIALHSAARGVKLIDSPHSKVSLDCIVELLIKEGSDLETRHKLGLTPLQTALKVRNISVAKILIMNGADISSMVKENNELSYPSFHLIAKIFDEELIKLSLDYGADYMSRDTRGYYPCQVALITSIVEDFVAYNSDCRRSSHSGKRGLTVIKLFWKYGFPFDWTLQIDWLTPNVPTYPTDVAVAVRNQKMLMKGVKARNYRKVERAIAQGADVKCCSQEQWSALHFIASRGDDEILNEFVKRGVCVNTLNKNGETPLHQAARSGHINCCRLLLEHGAVYNYSTSEVKTPLQLAKQNNHMGVVKLLTSIDKHFKEIGKGNLKKLKPNMQIYVSAMNCCGRDGKTLLGRATFLGMTETATRLMRLRLQMT